MKPVRRKIRRHFGLTAKQVAVRSQRPWYVQWLLPIILIGVGYGFAYWQLTKDKEGLTQALEENQALQAKVIQQQRQLQIEQSSQANLQKELSLMQDESIHAKEELLFYKNMLGSKKK